jgi:hypothetical protein
VSVAGVTGVVWAQAVKIKLVKIRQPQRNDKEGCKRDVICLIVIKKCPNGKSLGHF